MDNKLSRKERDFLRHKAEIMNSAEELFAEEGYYNVTMDMIAERSEYSKGSLYNHFDSKEILFFEMLNERAEILKKGLRKVVVESLTIEQKLNTFVEFYFDFFLENIGFFRIAQREKYNVKNCTQEKMMLSLRKKYLAHIEDISSIVKLDKQKTVEESNLIASAISGMLNGLITRNFLYDDKIEIERIKLFAKRKTLKLIE